MNIKRFSIASLFAIFTFLVLSGMAFRSFILPLFDDIPIYKPYTVKKEDKARMPIDMLLSNIRNGHWHLLSGSFVNHDLFEAFKNQFELTTTEEGKISGGVFDRYMVQFDITSATPQAKDERPEYEFSLLLQISGEEKGGLTMGFRTVFDAISMQYLIAEANYSGSLGKGSRLGRTEGDGLDIPAISTSPCVVESDGGFTYIKLKNRHDDNASVHEAIVLGDSPNMETEIVPNDYYNTDAIQQAPFQGFTYTYENPKWTVCRKVSPKAVCNELFDRNITETYYPGNIISDQDIIDNELPVLFSNIKDGEGVLTVEYQGQKIPYPIGFFLDSKFKRVTALTANNERVHYGSKDGEYYFDTPEAITVIGNFLYVLDKGATNKLSILKYSLNTSGQFEYVYIGNYDFGLSLEGAVDITGFSTNEDNILYLLDYMDEAIIKIKIDPVSGLMRLDSDNIKKIYSYSSYDGQKRDIGKLIRIQTSPRNSNTGQNIIMAIKSGGKTLSFNTDGLNNDSQLVLNFSNLFPSNTTLMNIGYNLGNNTFNITDLYHGKLHVFSNQGDYLGSGGKFGKSEVDEEFFYPNVISSNLFADDAIEMIVCSSWTPFTGFKRIFPKADIGKIEVVEKSPVAMEQVEDNMLMFRYALTAGNDIDRVSLKLNGEVIKEITDAFFPNVFSENFLVNGEGEDGLKGILKSGWNTYEIELTARIPGPENGNLQYRRSKSMQFYFIPSIISDDADFVIGNSPDADIPHSLESPFYLYKNMLIDGEGIFSISGGKIILMQGCTLKIAKDREMYAMNEQIELMCGANIEVNIKEDIPKLFKDSHFNGLDNYNMVSCRGDYTGGLGSGSAPSSMMEFISCSFENYLGKAVHVIEGRSSVANCFFEAKEKYSAATAAAIAVDPLARLDVRGGAFRNNDIAIDGNGADLYIGRAASSYKGVPITYTIFEKNTVGLHTFSGYTEIQYCDFDQNTIAVIDLNGTLDISKNSQNTFNGNVQGVVFSNVLIGETGKNKFINNNVDITYLVPPGEIAPTEIDLSCNYWKHDEVVGSAVIDIISDPEYDPATQSIRFETNPFLVQNGNSDSYTCTGGKGKNGRYIADGIAQMTPTTYHVDLLQVMDDVNGQTDSYLNLAELVGRSDGDLRLSDYTRNEPLSFSQEKALLKNGLFAYLYRSYKVDKVAINESHYNAAYNILADGFTHHNHYVNITKDKLAFAMLLLKDKHKVEPPTFVAPDFKENNYIVVYPNPSNGFTNVTLSIPEDGNYTLAIYSIKGEKTKNVFENKKLVKGDYYSLDIDINLQKSGIYFVKLENGALIETVKLIKK
jgi:hypothetical protein